MIRLLDMLSTIFTTLYAIIFFWMFRTFLPLRRNPVLKVLAFFVCMVLADSIIYSNDFASLFGPMLAFFVYVLLFHRGTLVEKLSVVLMFYPVMVAVNYLMLDISTGIYVGKTHVIETLPDSPWLLLSTTIHTISIFLRLVFWIGAWLFLRKYLAKVTSQMTAKMWMIVDALMLSSFVAIFTIIYFMPEDTLIEYPICFTAIVSSFGCMYLASYICETVQERYRAQRMEMQSNYYKQKIQAEEQVRRIYHDMKNHLLILESDTEHTIQAQETIRELRERIQDYENYIHTGNEFLDIIVRDKAKAAKEKEIDFSVQAHFEDADFLEPLDVSTMFGNALDNAIEASEKLPAGERIITMKANRVRDMLVIIVSNNTQPNAVLPDKTSKKDTLSHGFGLSNIRDAAEKYGGLCSTKLENGVFTLKMILPIS